MPLARRQLGPDNVLILPALSTVPSPWLTAVSHKTKIKPRCGCGPRVDCVNVRRHLGRTLAWRSR
jgi:hypothetical protein